MTQRATYTGAASKCLNAAKDSSHSLPRVGWTLFLVQSKNRRQLLAGGLLEYGGLHTHHSTENSFFFPFQAGGYGGHVTPELPGKSSGIFTSPENKSPHALHCSSTLQEFLPRFTLVALSLPTS